MRNKIKKDKERSGYEVVQYGGFRRKKLFFVSVCGLMRLPVLGCACMTPSGLVMGKMINSVKIPQQLVTAKQQI